MRAVSAIALLVYPFAVWFALTHWSPRWVAVLALALLGLRRALASEALAVASESRWALGAVIALCIAAALSNQSALLLAVPVVTSAFAAWLFGASLRSTPLAERFARAERPELSTAEVRYCRSVTRLWCGFLTANACVALALGIWASLAFWALYTGLVFYLLMASLFAAELAVRRFRFPHTAGPRFQRLFSPRVR